MTQRLSAIEQAFPRRTRPLLMTGLVVGDPFVDATLDYMNAVVEGGADVIELLVPFSDPIYHGPVMRRASDRAMSEKISWDDVERLVDEFRSGNDETPVIVSSYFNRILAREQQRCIAGLADAGADGFMITDLPAEEANDFRYQVEERDMALIQTVAPTTSRQRFRKLIKKAHGMIVWTGHSGGELAIDYDEFRERIAEFRHFTSLPLVASMNVESGDEAAAVARAAHGVLVGSSLAWLIEGRGPNVEDRLEAFVADLRVHLDEID